MNVAYIPSRGDFIRLDFTPQSGHEQRGARPALVVSNDFFNQHTGLALVCPLTSTRRDYPLHVEVMDSPAVHGYIMVEQTRSIDYRARNAAFIARAPVELVEEVCARLRACLA